MAGDETALQRLLRPGEAQALLASFGTLDPTLGLAIIRADRRPLATAGHWPGDALAETLRAVDEFAQPDSNRSRVIEEAVVEYIDRHRRKAREARDLEILNASAEALNREMEDTLAFQVDL